MTGACVFANREITGDLDFECLDNHVVLADASAANRVPIVETTSATLKPFIRARTGAMGFVRPNEACRYGSTIIDEANGEILMQETSPSGTNWVVQ